MNISYTELKEKTIAIVKEVSHIMTEANFEVSEKGGQTNIVTTADVETQRALHQALSALLPDSGFFCEEEDLIDNNKEYVWIIDPIDGTMNFSRGIGECAISVALLHNGTPVVGVVYNPFQNEIYAAEKGRGATKNGKPIHVSDAPFEKALFCTAMSTYRKEFAKTCFDIIEEAYWQCNDIRRFGTSAVELCYMAAGKCELYYEMRLFPWDYAAAGLIFTEAGGILTGFAGGPIPYDRPSPLIGANTQENYDRLSAIVHRHMDHIPYEG